MFEALSLPLTKGDGGGEVKLLESTKVHAGERGRFVFEYLAGEHGIEVKGSIRFQTSPFWNWDPPQTVREDAPGYAVVQCPCEGVELRVSTLPQCLRIEIAGRKLEAGETVRIEYGAGPGSRVDRFAEREESCYFFVDGDGDGIAALTAAEPRIEIEPRPASDWVVTVPSSVCTGAAFPIKVGFLDALANAAFDFSGTVEIARVEGLELPEKIEIVDGRGGAVVEGRTLRAGVFRIETRVEEGRRVSNPMRVEDQVQRILWADLHGHSQLSDGTGTPEDYFRYARDFSALDVAALTDHDHWGMRKLDQTPEMWARIGAAVKEFHAPGSFVTLLGYEWTSWLYGHRHVLYFADEGKVLSCMKPATETPQGLWMALEDSGLPALTFAHHTGGEPVATDWSFAPHPVLEPLVEIISVHGSSEVFGGPLCVRARGPGHFVRDALALGYRLGFVGSGDSHDGHPGLTHRNAFSGGLAAIYSETLERDAVLQALRRRHTYATSGARIVLSFALGGHPMGSILKRSDLPPVLHFQSRVIGTAPIQSVELIKNGATFDEQSPSGDDALLTFDDPTGNPGDYYYLRVTQTDHSLAFSSPIYLD